MFAFAGAAGWAAFDAAFEAEFAGNVTVSLAVDSTTLCGGGASWGGAAAGAVSVVSVVSSGLADRTDLSPLKTGSEIISAVSIKTIAEPIVNFAKTEAVPRGANAVLATLLVNRAPASVFPG